MADYTSAQTGDWNNVATWGGGGYPGDTGAQDDTATVAAGHVVTLNITALTGTVSAVTSAATSKIIVGANFNTDDDFIGDWNLSGELEYGKAGATTYELRVKGTINILTGGHLDMDASAAACKNTLSIQCVADKGDALNIQSGATTACIGRAKDVDAWISGNAAATDTDIDVDDGVGGDVSGWEVGDELVLTTDDADETHSEAVTITVDNGFAGGKHNFTCDVLVSDHLDNSRVYNLTRSCVIQGSDITHAAWVDIDAGSVVDFDLVEFYHLDEVTYAWTTGATAKPFAKCSAWGYEDSEMGFVCAYGAGSADCEFEECVAWNSTEGNSVCFNTNSSLNDCIVLFDRCYAAGAGSGRGFNVRLGVRLDACEISGCGSYGLTIAGDSEIDNSYIWACDSDGITFDDGQLLDRCSLFNTVFGEDPGGHAAANGVDISLSGIDYYTTPRIFLYNCKLGSATEVANLEFMQWDRGYILSVQHDQTTGYVKEWQRGGVIESNAAEDRSAPYCRSCDPSSTTTEQELIFRRRFVVDVGDTPTLTFWAKDNNPANDGVYTVVTGSEDCGLGAVAAGSPFTLTGNYAQKTITFTNAATRDGEVEVLIKIGDNAGADVIVYIDDFKVAGV